MVWVTPSRCVQTTVSLTCTVRSWWAKFWMLAWIIVPPLAVGAGVAVGIGDEVGVGTGVNVAVGDGVGVSVGVAVAAGGTVPGGT